MFVARQSNFSIEEDFGCNGSGQADVGQFQMCRIRFKNAEFGNTGDRIPC